MQAQDEATGQPENQAEGKGYPAHLDGVAGWLGFLVASLLALGPVVTLVTTALELSDTATLYPSVVGTALWQSAQTITWISVAAYIVISVYAGLRLLRKHVPSSIPIAIACLWLAGPVVGIVSLMAIADAGAEPSAADVGGAIGRPLVWATVWTLYLLLSKRVRNTYLRGRSVRSAALGSWGSFGKKRRQLVFFSACWVIVAFLYYQLVSPLDPYPEDVELQKMWAIILLPPVLFGIGSWGYARFVDVND